MAHAGLIALITTWLKQHLKVKFGYIVRQQKIGKDATA